MICAQDLGIEGAEWIIGVNWSDEDKESRCCAGYLMEEHWEQKHANLSCTGR